MSKKFFVISIDAMVHEDVEYMMTKPNFSKIMAKRAEVERACTVYPSLTYPAHSSILTGCRPGKHGICTNQPLKTFSDDYSHWYLKSSSLQVEDLFAAAKRAGCSTAAVYWPITGCNPNIDYIIDEYFFYFPGKETIEEGFAKLGANELALQAVRESMDRFPTRIRQKPPTLPSTFDDFLMGCACSLIRNAKPDVMLVHNCYLDSFRHYYGVFSPETKDAMDQIDLWLGEVLQAMEDAGCYEDVNFVILSDHGQMDFTRTVRMNSLLRAGGFIDVAPDGSVYHWDAYAKASGMSTTIFLSDPNNEALFRKVYDYLLELAKDESLGIGAVHPADELRERYGTYGTFSFMVETDGTTAFSDDYVGDFIAPGGIPGYRSKHGYEPEKGPHPVFLASGPAFKAGAVIPDAFVIDEAPTIAAALGQEMPQAEGRVLRELLV